jgi:hypothetical protein
MEDNLPAGSRFLIELPVAEPVISIAAARQDTELR